MSPVRFRPQAPFKSGGVMNLSSVPHTVNYEIKKLEEQLKEIEQQLIEHQSDKKEIVNFSWAQYLKTRDEIEKELHYLNQLFIIDSPDPTRA